MRLQTSQFNSYSYISYVNSSLISLHTSDGARNYCAQRESLVPEGRCKCGSASPLKCENIRTTAYIVIESHDVFWRQHVVNDASVTGHHWLLYHSLPTTIWAILSCRPISVMSSWFLIAQSPSMFNRIYSFSSTLSFGPMSITEGSRDAEGATAPLEKS